MRSTYQYMKHFVDSKSISIKTDADALNRRRRRLCVRRKIYHIFQGNRSQYAGKCAWAYGVCSVKNKIENKTSYQMYFQPKIT
jgi:hypothetical protein